MAPGANAPGEVRSFDPLARHAFLDPAEIADELARTLRAGWTELAVQRWREHVAEIDGKLCAAGYQDDEARRRAIAAHTSQVRSAIVAARSAPRKVRADAQPASRAEFGGW